MTIGNKRVKTKKKLKKRSYSKDTKENNAWRKIGLMLKEMKDNLRIKKSKQTIWMK